MKGPITAPMIPVRIVSTAVTAGIPPMMRAISIDTAAVADFGASERMTGADARRDRDGRAGEDAGERARDQRADDLRRASFILRDCDAVERRAPPRRCRADS